MDSRKFRECRGILFDFGGTLDSDGEHWLDRFYALYQSVGIDFTFAEIKRAFYQADTRCYGDPQVFSLGLRPLMKHHVHLQFEALNLDDPGKEQKLVRKFCAKSEYFLRRNACLLDRMRQHYCLGLVSNFYGNVAAICNEAGLSRSLNVVLDSARIKKSKPNPEIFLIALFKLDLLPKQVVFVGDSYERDMIPAFELGMKTLWLKGPNSRIPENAGGPVDDWISSLTALEMLM